MSNRYVIANKNEPDLLWSNSEGWTDGDDFEVFSLEESEELSLPIEGEWSLLVTHYDGRK